MSDQEQPDELDALVARAQAGDADAMQELLTELQPMVLLRCSKFLPYRMDAEEAAQDALLTISRKLDTFSGRGAFRGWVTVIASNSARATYRSLRRRSETVGATAVPEQADPRTTSVIAGTRIDLLDSLSELEDQHPLLVEPFVLRDLGEMSYDQIAATTDLPLSTVKDRIHRARGFVRSRLLVRLEGS